MSFSGWLELLRLLETGVLAADTEALGHDREGVGRDSNA